MCTLKSAAGSKTQGPLDASCRGAPEDEVEVAVDEGKDGDGDEEEDEHEDDEDAGDDENVHDP